MPVILAPEDEDTWLDPDADHKRLVRLFEPLDASRMEAFPVSTRVNAPAHDDPSVLDPPDAGGPPDGRSPRDPARAAGTLGG